jgi:hypothetical protein
VDKPNLTALTSPPPRRRFSLTRGLRRDEGWNFMEATLSVAILTVVFLGLTITLIAFREWMTRAWAIRVMDQYANDIASHLHRQLALAHSFQPENGQYGLGAFNLSVINFDFSNPYHPFKDSTVYHYSARPNEGIFRAMNNSAALKLDPDFPPDSWSKSNRFHFTQFTYQGPYNQEIGRTPAFAYPMVRIYFSINYERPRTVELPQSYDNRSYELEKRYVISGFLKNYGLSLE